MSKPFRLCREINGEIVDMLEIEADTIEEAIEKYWILLKS